MGASICSMAFSSQSPPPAARKETLHAEIEVCYGAIEAQDEINSARKRQLRSILSL